MNHRGTTTAGALQAIGTQFAGRNPEGSEFDDALINAGLDALPSPKIPALTIFWDPGTPPQPAAILVDSSEPMWRSRPLPTLITDPPPGAAQRYQMTSQLWMDLVQQVGGDNIAHSEAYLDGPSATNQFYTILDNKLTVAPWEETD